MKLGVSWDDAQREAQRWIDGLNLQNVSGTTVDLRGPAEKLLDSLSQIASAAV